MTAFVLTKPVPGGGGTTTIGGSPAPVSIFGSEFQRAESSVVSTTTSTTFQNKVTLNTIALPAGTYRVAFSYGWNHNDTGSDFEAQFLENGTPMGQIHKQEPKDSAGGFSTTGTNQRYYMNRVFYRTHSGGSPASRTYELNYRTDTSGDESSIWEAVIEFWRVS